MKCRLTPYLLRFWSQVDLSGGFVKVSQTDVRVIAATNVDLLQRVKKGKFREDLYYRLNTVPINIPALKDRRGRYLFIVPEIFTDIAERYKSEPIRLEERNGLLSENYRWRGNIRGVEEHCRASGHPLEKRLLSSEFIVPDSQHGKPETCQ
ncbi:MAG: sigma 54-interacting transcriptional regulator [Saprospiraceae bacterium]